MTSPKTAQSPFTRSLREVFAIRGQPLPKELESVADTPFDYRYLNALPKAESTVSGELIRNPDEYLKANPGAKIPTAAASAIKPQQVRPGNATMTPEQQAAYERMMGLPSGSAANMTVGQFGSGVSNVSGQRAAGERQGNAIAASGARQDKSLAQGQAHFEESKDLERNRAVMEPRTRMEKQISSLGRIGDYIDSAQAMNMSYPDYLKLRGQSSVGNVAGFFGSKIGQLSPEEEARLAKYNEIGGGFVKNIFETGGKQLTGIEKSLVQKYEINPGDSTQQIRAKARGLTDYMEKDFEAQASAIETVNPQAAAELRSKASDVIGQVRQKFMNASQIRAQGARSKSGQPATIQGVDMTRHKNAVRQFPTKGTAAAPKEGAIREKDGVSYKRTGGQWVEILEGGQ
jgi:ElaB/YqjD/DUF883 family membrane-anchored ribosome-binding protein